MQSIALTGRPTSVSSSSEDEARRESAPRATELVFSPVPGIVCIEEDASAESEDHVFAIAFLVAMICSLFVYLLYLLA